MRSKYWLFAGTGAALLCASISIRAQGPGQGRGGRGGAVTLPDGAGKASIDYLLVKKWFKFFQTHVPLAAGGFNRFGHDEYTHYYYAQANYILGDDGWEKLFLHRK